jgi:acetyl esterase/lipase
MKKASPVITALLGVEDTRDNSDHRLANYSSRALPRRKIRRAIPHRAWHPGQSVSMDQPKELYEKLQAAGVPVSFIKVNDVHTFRTPEARRQLAFETLEFFNRNLGVAK